MFNRELEKYKDKKARRAAHTDNPGTQETETGGLKPEA